MSSKKEDLTIDEINYKDIVTTNKLEAGKTGPIITIKVPKGQEIEIIGIDYGNIRDAHTLKVRFSDKDDHSIDLSTKIIINHERSNEIIKTTKLFYSDISMIKCVTLYEDVDLTKPLIMYNFKTNLEWYRFKDTITLEEGDALIISAIKPNKDIEKIKFALDAMIRR